MLPLADSVTAVVHTAGVSPVQATVDAILRVDLLGTALMLDAFGEVIGSGGAGVFVASMAGTMASLDLDFERRLATTPADQLLELPELSADAISESGTAYTVAKRANQVRVQAASLSWGRRGARVNSLSPGVIATSMGEAELDGPHGEIMRAMIAASGTGRMGPQATLPEQLTSSSVTTPRSSPEPICWSMVESSPHSGTRLLDERPAWRVVMLAMLEVLAVRIGVSRHGCGLAFDFNRHRRPLTRDH